ncbi:hypothetical protein F5Y18DRAFT_430926 [Xylariaceae sp. FL1019]|nr:hypothetical protein F5Y18DRAFT_430926 [Xylariaceae sp. FL1019]
MPGEIRFQAFVDAPLEVVWRAFQLPAVLLLADIPVAGWRTMSMTVDLRVGGQKLCNMKHRDGDRMTTTLTYDRVEPMSVISGRMEAGLRKHTEFVERNGGVLIRQAYDATRSPPYPYYSVRNQRRYYEACLGFFARYVSDEWRVWKQKMAHEHKVAGYSEFLRQLGR